MRELDAVASDGTPPAPGAPAEATLDSWKRLRALTDVVQEQQKEGEHLDRKVRFALIVMGLLNGAMVFGVPGGFGNGVGPLLLAVALVDVYFFVHVVQALTPGGLAAAREPPRGLRSSGEIASTDLDAYTRAWQAVGVEQLLGELAAQAHALGSANTHKAAIVRRLFLSLHAMTALAAVAIGRAALR